MDKFGFLSGNGEMEALTRNFNWSATPLGPIADWPQSLRTTLSTILRSRVPMLLWWGPELLSFYNDAFRPSLGTNGKHPSILGLPAEKGWSDIWHIVGAQVSFVLEKGEGTWNEDLLIPIFRNGALEEAWWTFGYTPVFGESNHIDGILVTVIETTLKIKAQSLVEEKARQLEVVIDSADLGFWDRDLISGKLSFNPRLKEFFGFDAGEQPKGEDFLGRMNDEDRQRLLAAIADSRTPGSDGGFDIEYAIPSPGARSEMIVRAKGKTLFDRDGAPVRFTGTLQDITHQRWTLRSMETSQRQVLDLFEEAPVAICTMTADDDLRFLTANRFYGELVGRDPSQLVGKPLLEALPEIKGQGFDDLIRQVISSGIPYTAYEVPVQLTRSNDLETVFVNFSYIPRRSVDGKVIGILVTATDVSYQVHSRQAIEENEILFRSLIEAAPFPIGVYLGKDLRIVHANPAIIEIYGKGPDVIGKNYLELLPELTRQGIAQQITEVYSSGIPFFSDTSRVDIEVNQKTVSYYFKYSFIPLFDPAGNVYGILNTGVDVTELELARQRAQDAELNLRSAVEVAELASWTIDIPRRVIHLSPRLRKWTGIADSVAPLEQFFHRIPHPFQADTAAAYEGSLHEPEEAVFDIEHPLIDPVGNNSYYVHVRGRIARDAAHPGTRIIGTMQDITAQRKIRWQLEKQVAERTAELASLNSELEKAVRELVSRNADLEYSNDELSQYAYITSHDLQEPLRKIRFYISMLTDKFTLPPETGRLLQNINKSCARMTLLIRDLLSFSRLLGSDESMVPINLNEVIGAVLEDFELSIMEKTAVVDLDPLPVVKGIRTQINQLFHNLIANALKFTASDRKPHIRISSRPLAPDEAADILPQHRDTSFYEITVADNGIGFETEYQTYIFELFKQLHPRDVFPGSGIGLALCRRITTNHGGHIYARSVVGKGSTFYVLLPVPSLT